MILCCGEALIDMIPSPTRAGPNGFVPHTGGAVFNTAIALGRLGVKAGLFTGVSHDMFGAQLVQALKESKVDTTALAFSGRPTTLAFVELVDGHATYSFYDENSASRMLDPDALPTISPEVSTLFFGGISLACEPCADTHVELAVRECDKRVIALDPNIRPDFIQNVARFRKRLEQMISISDIVKISDEDLDWIYPEQDTIAKKVTQLRANGPAVVILTRGAEGASAYFGTGQEVRVPSKPVCVVDTVGAGDTFNAGFLAELSQQGALSKQDLRSVSAETIAQALAFGAKVAAVTVSRAGAQPPWAEELS
ncbi:carbohydrate kinase [Sulfitobacter sp. M57]|uniref:carbohydrate kinase family protein n=1 Tax=unclassified Sulfitobacter TaxID=196795 RepID=UPI0023E0EB51|nr:MULTISPECIES: carbohydrate kinase [unclassified Sulfitobacter]MDF3412833.1 carbohydrate kinase [Sulfitobacter sp. KE5]MDF3421882.1 carbohydrate kinase [Sulfitobacter sp. KE43]MDF3431382.1 carbohydrate kinase [Sulfitobacter sp. KE42]MDF3457023.1 carbohydrate kinase [Sulfitobacter sp. S74]MDF3460926.1 carbohydrate kinase [Sulfitobacter sp. Ks18]